MMRESKRPRVKTPWPKRTVQRAFASMRTSVAEPARATTARMALDPASSAAMTRGGDATGIGRHLLGCNSRFWQARAPADWQNLVRCSSALGSSAGAAFEADRALLG